MQTQVKLAAAAGMAAPLIFGAALLSLTLAQYDFLRSLGWDPLTAPTFDWPSGLALGPGGGWMTAAFVVSGALVAIFGWGIGAALAAHRGGRWIGAFFLAAGVGLAGLASPTDPTLTTITPTLHGRIHDLSYVVLGASFLAALLASGLVFRRLEHGTRLSRLTWFTLFLALPAFLFKGLAFYLLLGALFAWGEAAAFWLWRSQPGQPSV